jgi:hypothetical protein
MEVGVAVEGASEEGAAVGHVTFMFRASGIH